MAGLDFVQQVNEAIDNKIGHGIGVGAASTNFITYIDLGIKVLSAVYLVLLITSMIDKRIKDRRGKQKTDENKTD
jgi:hypothetical protein